MHRKPPTKKTVFTGFHTKFKEKVGMSAFGGRRAVLPVWDPRAGFASQNILLNL
jgi:hypothetical protein